jgi:uncharacterized protein
MSKDTNQVPSEWVRLEMSERSGAVRFPVHVRPRSSRCSILGVREGALDVALTAPPAEGAANEELRKVLARALEVRRGDVNIIVGTSSRSKLIEINGISINTARELLAKAKR